MDKVCSRCKLTKPLESFNKDKTKPDGFSSWCRDCKQQYDTEYRKLHSTGKYHHKYLNKDVSKRRAESTIRHHVRLGYTVKITVEELTELFEKETHCPICGVEYSKEYGVGRLQHSQSLDRINNETELRYENIWIICSKCNASKGDKTMKEFVEYSLMVYNKYKEMI
jgi:5-methylcytosine-specific restriction endonuclease McrA